MVLRLPYRVGRPQGRAPTIDQRTCYFPTLRSLRLQILTTFGISSLAYLSACYYHGTDVLMSH